MIDNQNSDIPYTVRAELTLLDNDEVIPVPEMKPMQLDKLYEFNLKIELDDKLNRKSVAENLEFAINSSELQAQGNILNKIKFNDQKISSNKIVLIPKQILSEYVSGNSA